MAARSATFFVLYLLAVMVGRATRLDGTQLALVWPASGVAFLWLADAWRHPARRRLNTAALFVATVAGNVASGTMLSLSLIFGVANVVHAVVACALFARLRPDAWTMAKAEDLRALLIGAAGGGLASAAIGPVAVLLLTDERLAGGPVRLDAAQRRRHAGRGGRRTAAPAHPEAGGGSIAGGSSSP